MMLRANRAKLLGGVSAIGAALMLSGCVTMTTTAYVSPAPAPHWANIAGFEEYEWIDRADALSQAVGEAPPDYAFVAGTSEPWVWTFDDGSMLIVESRADGLHSYYFEAGSDSPFLVRDPEMSFGFLEGGVAVVYGPDGGVLSREEAAGWLYAALGGFQRGRVLRRTLAATQERRAIQALAWIDTSYLFWDWRRDWDDGIRRHPNWQRVRDGVRGRQRRDHWDGERRRRHEAGEGFRRWGEGGWRGRAPGNYVPPPPGTVMPPMGQPPQQAGPVGPGRNGQPGAPGTGRGPRPGQQNEGPLPGRPGARADGGDRPDNGPRTGGAMPTPLEGSELQPDLGVRPLPGRSGQRPGGPANGRGRAESPVTTQSLPPVPVTAPPPPSVPAEAAIPASPPPTPVRNMPARNMEGSRGNDGGRNGSRPERPSFRQPDAQPGRVGGEGYTPPSRNYAPPPTQTYSPTPTPSYTPPPAPSYTPPPAPSYSAPAPSYSPPPPPPAPSYSPPPPPPSPPPPPPPSTHVESRPIGDD